MRQTLFAAAAAMLLITALPACQTATGPSFTVAASDDAAIRSVLSDQTAAWNAGDIDGFMQGYWNAPALRFASGGKVRRGFDETLASYKANYASRAAMGTLAFSDLEVVGLSRDAAVVHGHWRLTRANDAPSGLFTLVFRQIDGEWKIISDTTTSAD